MKRYNYLTYLFIVAAAALVAACNPSKEDQLKKLKAQQADLVKQIATLEKEVAGTKTDVARTKEVVTVELAPRKFEKYVQTQGAVEATDNIMISAKTAGVITNVYVREGDAVVKGQTLAQIDNTLTLRGIDEVKSGLELANTVYARQKNLWDQKIGTEVQYLQAKNSKESLEKKLATLEEQLDMSKIKSLITGVVDEVTAKVGQNAAPGQPAFRVINNNNLKITAKISEAYLSTIKKGNKALISFSDYDKKLEGPVNFVGRNIDPLSRSFSVEIKVPSNADLRPNMTAIVKVIFTSVPAALCVPINVVQDINGEKIVYVAESNGTQLVARKKVVKIDGVYDNYAQVTSGLAIGDKIITVGYQGLNDGELIKI
ncbi:MAG: efflux RND transporter periplasmic adaptor subunit [Bacteroidetes bacterium]|nr:efflux RND transporter periplasmic adaptor subunit [Bacteroidota bacterium]